MDTIKNKKSASSPDHMKKCPKCEGGKVLEGTCVCNSEWRGTQTNDEWTDCQCTPTTACPDCNGTGLIMS